MWKCVQELSMPDASKYAATLAAIKQFEADLIEEQSQEPSEKHKEKHEQEQDQEQVEEQAQIQLL